MTRIAYNFTSFLPWFEDLTTGVRFGFVGDKPFVGFDLSSAVLINQ